MLISTADIFQQDKKPSINRIQRGQAVGLDNFGTYTFNLKKNYLKWTRKVYSVKYVTLKEIILIKSTHWEELIETSVKYYWVYHVFMKSTKWNANYIKIRIVIMMFYKLVECINLQSASLLLLACEMQSLAVT